MNVIKINFLYGVIAMYLRLAFLILLCIPVIYIFIILLGHLIDEIIKKNERKNDDIKKYHYEEDYIFQEYRTRKRKGDFKVIR